MFRRRTRYTLRHRVRDFLWPRAGFRRSMTYLGHRIGRLPGTPYSIAAGFACGAAVSFTPFLGFHFLLAALLALVVRGNLIASALGTVVGNPWTFPAIWLATFRLGAMVLGDLAGEAELPGRLTMALIVENPWQVFLPMAMGGILLGSLAWVVFFFPVRAAVAAYQKRRRRRRPKEEQSGPQEHEI